MLRDEFIERAFCEETVKRDEQAVSIAQELAGYAAYQIERCLLNGFTMDSDLLKGTLEVIYGGSTAALIIVGPFVFELQVNILE